MVKKFGTIHPWDVIWVPSSSLMLSTCQKKKWWHSCPSIKKSMARLMITWCCLIDMNIAVWFIMNVSYAVRFISNCNMNCSFWTLKMSKFWFAEFEVERVVVSNIPSNLSWTYTYLSLLVFWTILTLEITKIMFHIRFKNTLSCEPYQRRLFLRGHLWLMQILHVFEFCSAR
jgi:hypothetical protein